MTTPQQLVELLADEFGTFTDGYTSEDIDRTLGALAEATGLPLVCVWEYVDQWATGGASQIGVLVDGAARCVSPALWRHLHGDGTPGDLLATVRVHGPAALVDVTAPVADVVADPTVAALTRVGARNYVGDDRRPAAPQRG